MKNSEIKEQLVKLACSMESLAAEIEAAKDIPQEKVASVKTAKDFEFGKVSTSNKSASSNPMLDFLLGG